MNLPTKLTVGRIALAILLLVGLFTCDILCEAGVLVVPMLGPVNLVYLIAFIVFAVVVTAYCAFFVGTNMDYFVKLLDTKNA